MNIALPQALLNYVDEQVRRGRGRTRSEVVCQATRLLMSQEGESCRPLGLLLAELRETLLRSPPDELLRLRPELYQLQGLLETYQDALRSTRRFAQRPNSHGPARFPPASGRRAAP